MKYLSASALGITLEERAALLKVKSFLRGLENPKDITSDRNHSSFEAIQPHEAKFSMNSAIKCYDCGTAACIGGWMSLYMSGVKLKKTISVPESVLGTTRLYVYRIKGSLRDLFFPPNKSDTFYNAITPEQAREQITHFLRTGTTKW